MDPDLAPLVGIYRAEAAEHLAVIEEALLALETRGGADTDALHALLRSAHTLKGNSAILGFAAVEQASHELEDRVEQLRDGRLAWGASTISALLTDLDALRALVTAPAEVTPGAEPLPAAAGNLEQTGNATMRVNTARLDTLLTLTGEITIARGRLGALVSAAAGADAALAGTLWQLEQLHAALQGEVMQLRMVPLGPSFRAHHRTVRDVASRSGKQALLVIDGHDVEVDTSIAEQLRDPLTHMIRNAVDHGIETTGQRLAAGKPAAGRVQLSAHHESGVVVVVLEDDGRGLDRDRIAAKAEALGLLSGTAGLSDDQVFATIFESGFSTAEQVTALSGRGVGMDVVRRHIRALRGTIEVSSAPGRGTRFTIRLPLTVAIIDGFLVRVGTESYVLPLDAVEECVDFASVRPQAAAGGGLLNLRGAALPFVQVRDVLGLPTADAVARPSVVIVRHGERRVGLVVDALDGDCQAVIKPLTAGLQQLPAIAGSTILGTGRVALILNVSQLVDLAARGTMCDAA